MVVENRYPLYSKALSRLPLGAIKPSGWLLNQLCQQRDGLTGHLDELWPDVGPESGWLGGRGERWERGPYYCDGLLPLAYLLDEPFLIGKVGKWIDWAIKSQGSDGFFGPGDNRDWWPRFVIMKMLIQYFEATEDQRVISLLTRYFQYRFAMLEEKPLTDWGRARACDEVLVVLWLYNQTGEQFLSELADRIAAQGINWSAMFSDFPYTEKTSAYMDWKVVEEKKYSLMERQRLPYFETHVVNVAMGIKHPAIMQQIRGNDYGSILRKGIETLQEHHGTANGMFTGDEHINGRSPSQGTELCAVVEYMYSLEHAIETFGGSDLCDILEKVAFNALPAAITPDFTAHQYVQQVNQVLCTVQPRNWYNNDKYANIFGLEPNFGCCTANMHQGWPKLTQCLWMEKNEDDDKGLAAVSYAPCHVSWDGISFDVDTNYPFSDTIHINIKENKDMRTIWLRIPKWCTSPVLQVNGVNYPVEASMDGYIKLKGLKSGDLLRLVLVSETRSTGWYNNSIAVERGSLLFGLKISSTKKTIADRGRFSDFEIYPESEWRYALNFDAVRDASVLEREVPDIPFDHENPPVSLTIKARHFKDWNMDDNSASDLPISPVCTFSTEEEITLVPYGCTALRIAQFPYYIERKEVKETCN